MFKKLVSMVICMLIILSAFTSVGFAEESFLSNDEISQSNLELFYKIQAVTDEDSNSKYRLVDQSSPKSAPIKVFEQTVSYKTDVKIIIDFTDTGMPDFVTLSLYDGDEPLIKGLTGEEKISYTLRRVRSDKVIYIRFFDPSLYPYQFEEDIYIKLNLYVNDSLFDRIFAFFQGIFGALPRKEWTIYIPKDNDE